MPNKSEQRYRLLANLPTGETIVARESVEREEAERLAAILCDVTKVVHKLEPLREGDTWYVQSWDWFAHQGVLCWLEPVE